MTDPNFYKFTQGPRYNKFFHGQAIQESSYSTEDLVKNRNGVLNRARAKIGNMPANPLTTGIQANYLCCYFKDRSTGGRAPAVFDSLTGLGFDRNKTTRWGYMQNMVLAGRTQTAINTQGVIGGEATISVQVGGLGTIRYFPERKDETISWGDRLAWTIPNIDDETEEGATYRYLNSLAKAEFPKGKVPILVKKVTQEMYLEFPRVAMNYAAEELLKDISFYRRERFVTSVDPRCVWVRTNAVPIAKMVAAAQDADVLKPSAANDVKIVGAMVYLFSGLLTSKNFSAIMGSGDKNVQAAVGAFPKLDEIYKAKPADLKNLSILLMHGQYDCWSRLRDHCFGTALDIGVPGGTVKVLFEL